MSRSISVNTDHLKDKPASTIVAMLLPIWQHVLQRSIIDLEDNFFDVGGDPSLAIKLFTKIAQVCGRELLPEMIYLAPTITSQAALLNHPIPLRFPPLVLLKADTQDPPVFITHGLGGSIMGLFEVVRHIRSAHPIYGMQARGIDGLEEPFHRVEDLAHFYLDAIKKLQPNGPYRLIGHSFGGLITFEMARRLSESGNCVTLLALLDSYPHPHQLSLAQRARLLALRAKRRVSQVVKSQIREALPGVTHAVERKSPITSDTGHAAANRPPVDSSVSLAAHRARYRDCMNVAWSHYRPRFYGGKVTFVKAEISSCFPENPEAVWGGLVNEFEVETVPGDHVEMITLHAQSLAALLSRHIARGSGEQ